ncbi:hypothetical protein [Kitasatospora camelliae]|uniref:PH (Pleckstrin Homology) domain-containing protein n=1 Tax=Kitasatospora camelliae TaxID=3156397 RepID=A0AAU8K660_9ACTN
MTDGRRRRIVWGLRGLAVLALLSYLPGFLASRPGGLVVVERWLNHPVLQLGAAVVLTVVSAVVEFEFRTRWSQIGFAVVLVALGVAGLPVAFLSFALGGDARPVARTAAPDHPDRVVNVTDVAFSIDPVYRVELLTGSGWSTRHWDLGVWDRGAYFQHAEWTGPDRITVTADKQVTVFTVAPDGRPSEPRLQPR